MKPNKLTKDRKMIVASLFDFLHKKFGDSVKLTAEDRFIIDWDAGYKKRFVIGAAVVNEDQDERVEVRVKDVIGDKLLLIVRYNGSVNNIIDCVISITR